MRRKIILLVAVVISGLCTAYAAKAKVESPKNRHATSFAIVIDAETYRHCGDEVAAYRESLDRDGLAVYTISGTWKTPEEVRERLVELYERNLRKMPLEGAVFIGDIPFASIQNAQHMTTAFKMNEDTFPIQEASVTSDRFYDDLHLQFERIGRDSLNPLRFYYRLRCDAPQQLNPNFYSGRILYPADMGGDKYEAIGRYLRKVVAEREKVGQIQYAVTYAGDSYNSDCLVAWMDERIALGEMFPQLCRNDSRALTQLNFRMERFMKYALFDQLARPEVDIMLFNEHGSPDKQHISGEMPAESYSERAEAFRNNIYYMLAREKRKPDGDLSGAVEYFSKKYGLSEKFFEPFFAPEPENTPSVPDEINITLDDLRGRKPQPRFVMFNACYNGSFHQEGYIAGSYIFSEGRTVVAQGNTVNVLQDRWTYEMLGLLNDGVRVGQYNRLVATLEGHIIGDPAFRFRPETPNTLSTDMVIFGCNTPALANHVHYWRDLCENGDADVRSLAYRMLADGGAITTEELAAAYDACPFATTRMELLKLIVRNGYTPTAVSVVCKALNDSYEVVRRNAATYAWMLGAPELADALAVAKVENSESQRVCYLIDKALQLLPEEIAVKAMADAIARSGNPRQEDKELLRESVAEDQQRKHHEMKVLLDKSAPLKQRISSIRSVRNNTYHEYVPQLLALLQDDSEPVALRTITAEALGWFRLSYRREEILRACMALRTSEKSLAEEAIQTCNRLK